MGKKELRDEIQALYKRADAGESLAVMLDGVLTALRGNEDAIADVTHSYRICATDTGYTRAFSIKDGVVSEIGETDEADVTVSGDEKNLLAVFRKQVSPISALLRGKVRIKGSKAALIKFAEFL